MSTVLMLPVPIETVPVVMQALREKLSVLGRTVSTDYVRGRQIAEDTASLRAMIEQSEKQIERMAGRMLADYGKVPV